MESTMLDTMVRLATLGASGVSIFAIAWLGYILRRPLKDASSDWHRSVRHYMTVCAFFAATSAVGAYANAKFNAERNNELRSVIVRKDQSIDSLRATVRDICERADCDRISPATLSPESAKLLSEIRAE